MKCPSCCAAITPATTVCPACGHHRQPTAQQEAFSFPYWWIGLGVVGILVVAVIANMPSTSPDEERDAAVIKTCWSEDFYEHKTLDPSMKRFVAGTCYKLENDFKDKWHHSYN